MKPGYWSTETMLERLPTLIKPFLTSRVKHASYELALGSEAFITGEDVKQLIPDGGSIAIPSGQFAVLITDESVTIPDDAIAFISMKSGNKFRGLINVSGFHVDPGFSGRLLFSVFNAGVQNIQLSKGVPLFMIWYATLDRPTTNLYKGEHNGQMRIPDSIITNISAKHLTPSALQKEFEETKQTFVREISDVRKDVTLWKGITYAIIIAVVLNYVTIFFKSDKQIPPSTITIQYPPPSPGGSATPQMQPAASPTKSP